MDRVRGKVALVTGAARGQGRSHALRLAEEGADIIALDVAAELPFIPYRTGTPEELDETISEVKKLERRAVRVTADVRDFDAVHHLVSDAVAELGRLDIVCANAGLGANPHLAHELPEQEWEQLVSVNMTGVWKTCKVAIPHMLDGDRGGSIILTASVAGLRAYANIAHYAAAKHGVVGIMKTLALELAPRSIRVNCVVPTQVATPMILNETMYRLFRPDLEEPGIDDFAEASAARIALPIPWVEPIDVSNAVLFLASNEARYISGVALPVDGGSLLV
ncbi:MAG: mycofactocin-coupled SDR family oxidoreductase [Mycobacterium sp.]